MPSPSFASIKPYDSITSATSRGGLTLNGAPPNIIKNVSVSVSCPSLDNILPRLKNIHCLIPPAKLHFMSRKRALYLWYILYLPQKSPVSPLKETYIFAVYLSQREGVSPSCKERECLRAGPSGLPCYRPPEVGPNFPVSVLQCVAVGVFPVSRERKCCGGSSQRNITKSNKMGINMY